MTNHGSFIKYDWQDFENACAFSMCIQNKFQLLHLHIIEEVGSPPTPLESLPGSHSNHTHQWPLQCALQLTFLIRATYP